MTNVLIQCVIKGKLTRQTFFVLDLSQSEAVRNGAQTNTLGRHVLLSSDVSSSDDQRKAVKCRVRKFVILKNRLKRAALPSMIELHFGKPRCIERNRPLFAGRIEEFTFRHEEELCLGIDESSNEPRAGHPVHFDVAARDPLHV